MDRLWIGAVDHLGFSNRFKACCSTSSSAPHPGSSWSHARNLTVGCRMDLAPLHFGWCGKTCCCFGKNWEFERVPTWSYCPTHPWHTINIGEWIWANPIPAIFSRVLLQSAKFLANASSHASQPLPHTYVCLNAFLEYRRSGYCQLVESGNS